MEFSELVGRHLLTGVDRYNKDIQSYYGTEPAECLSFTLDGKTYTAVEDPDDGYRSSMREFLVSDHHLGNMFDPVPVIASLEEGDNDVLILKHEQTGKVILSVGTDYSESYYPCFVAHYDPEGLSGG